MNSPINPIRAVCCENGHNALSWRKKNMICGPSNDGWCMIVRTTVSTEFENVLVCPFCLKSVEQMTEKSVKLI